MTPLPLKIEFEPWSVLKEKLNQVPGVQLLGPSGVSFLFTSKAGVSGLL